MVGELIKFDNIIERALQQSTAITTYTSADLRVFEGCQPGTHSPNFPTFVQLKIMQYCIDILCVSLSTYRIIGLTDEHHVALAYRAPLSLNVVCVESHLNINQ